MKWSVAAIAVALSAGPLVPASATAQRSYHIGVAGGVVAPVGILRDTYANTGPSGLVTLVLGSPESPMGLRLDYQYDGFKGRSDVGAGGADIHINSITANLIVPFRVGYAKPYLIGGFGMYPVRLPGSADRENDWGANGGAGLTFALPRTGVSAFVEARYHAVSRSRTSPFHFVPITVGLMF